MRKIILGIILFMGTLIFAVEADQQSEFNRLLTCAKATVFSKIFVTPPNKGGDGKFGVLHVFTGKGNIRVPLTFEEADAGKADIIVKDPGEKSKKLITLKWNPEAATPFEDLQIAYEILKADQTGRDASTVKPSVTLDGNTVFAGALATHFEKSVQALSTFYEFDATAAKLKPEEFTPAVSNEAAKKILNTKIKNEFSLAVPDVLKQNTSRLEEFAKALITCKGKKEDQTLHVIALKEAVKQMVVMRNTQQMNADLADKIKRDVAQSIEMNYLDGLAGKKYGKPELVLSGVTGYIAQKVANARGEWKPKALEPAPDGPAEDDKPETHD